MSQVVGARDLLYTRAWHHVSCRDRTLGRLAESIARVLMGKHKPFYEPNSDRYGDFVVVTNCEDILVTGRKETQKMYYRHTTQVGSLRGVRFDELRVNQPERIIRRAVAGMLPKNSHRHTRLIRLKLYRGDEHPYEANILKQYTDPVPKAETPQTLAQSIKKPDPQLVGPQGLPSVGPVTRAIREHHAAKVEPPKFD